jgi:hypothetical protein
VSLNGGQITGVVGFTKEACCPRVISRMALEVAADGEDARQFRYASTVLLASTTGQESSSGQWCVCGVNFRSLLSVSIALSA